MDSEKYYYYEKIDRVKDAELNSDLAYIIEQLGAWSKKSPENKSLNKMIEAFMNCYSIMQSYQTDRQMYHKALSEFRGDKLRAIDRARRSEEENEKDSPPDLSKFIKKS
jgi:hypothetical protein|tara:strand:+ start:133 stop:459 length:327 start_codon:yes stop_codon:yes gene_type:complete